MAAYIVEKITGKRFEDYVTENFFQPIGMKSASYFQTSAPATTLYHDDGKTPFPYWNILLRPAGSINASANDMAAYVAFYLNRGTVSGTEVMPAASIDRMENPTRTWAAQEGLKPGYGLSNYWAVNDGFVYHGHDGGVNGGITEMAYMPEYGVGYFYSINAGNADAFEKIGKAIRAYITRDLTKPALPPQGQLPGDAATYEGWYEPDSPRIQMFYFFERLLGMVRVHFGDEKMLIWPVIGMKDEGFLPVSGRQFRKIFEKDPPSPVATVMLLTPDAEGRFIQTSVGTRTLKRISTGMAMVEIGLTGCRGAGDVGGGVVCAVLDAGRDQQEETASAGTCDALVASDRCAELGGCSGAGFGFGPGYYRANGRANGVVGRGVCVHDSVCGRVAGGCGFSMAGAGRAEVGEAFQRGRGAGIGDCYSVSGVLGSHWAEDLGVGSSHPVRKECGGGWGTGSSCA